MSDTASDRSSAFHEMRDYYSDELLKYLGDPGQPGLREAHQFGEKAIHRGLRLEELAEIHHEALIAVLMRRTAGETPLPPAAESALLLRPAGTFLAASLSPYADRYSRSEEVSAALRYMIRRLDDRTARVAHALYDQPLQLVAALQLVLNGIAARYQSGSEREFAAVTNLLDQLELQLSALSHELHPTVLDHLGLDAAADWLAAYFNRLSGARVEVQTSGRLPLSPALARVMYSAIQEALTSIATHAQATKVSIRLQQEEKSVTCAIRDDGVGFDDTSRLSAWGERGLWLIGIRESVREFGGNMIVNSSQGDGTEVIIDVPLSD